MVNTAKSVTMSVIFLVVLGLSVYPHTLSMTVFLWIIAALAVGMVGVLYYTPDIWHLDVFKIIIVCIHVGMHILYAASSHDEQHTTSRVAKYAGALSVGLGVFMYRFDGKQLYEVPFIIAAAVVFSVHFALSHVNIYHTAAFIMGVVIILIFTVQKLYHMQII